MEMPDVNILIYAHRRDDSVHGFYRSWLEQLAGGPSPFALSALVATAFVRIVTGPRFKNGPSELDDAISFVDGLATAPSCRLVGVSTGSWALTRDLCRNTRTTGARISDAHHAAVAIEHGCTFVSRDPDFRRFEPHGLSF